MNNTESEKNRESVSSSDVETLRYLEIKIERERFENGLLAVKLRSAEKSAREASEIIAKLQSENLRLNRSTNTVGNPDATTLRPPDIPSAKRGGRFRVTTPSSQTERKVKKSGLFDERYYCKTNCGQSQKRGPIRHFLTSGAKSGLDPTPLFDSKWYLKQYPDVAAAKINPFLHYIDGGEIEGRQPNALFSPCWYLERNRDVANAHISPLFHYIEHGAAEGRDPHPLFDSDWYWLQFVERDADISNPLGHYLRVGAQQDYDPHPLFDTSWYRSQPGVRIGTTENPLEHYYVAGYKTASPHPLFDGIWYLKQYPEVFSNPLEDYLYTGWKQGREPNPTFDGDAYLKANPNLLKRRMSPLLHAHLTGRSLSTSTNSSTSRFSTPGSER